MGISTALFEERITDNQTGQMLNADMEFYKLAGIRDVGDTSSTLESRGPRKARVIGLGEPPRSVSARRSETRSRMLSVMRVPISR
jgi:xanthine dehydrogenase YagR molybdenum-binding subunit